MHPGLCTRLRRPEHRVYHVRTATNLTRRKVGLLRLPQRDRSLSHYFFGSLRSRYTDHVVLRSPRRRCRVGATPVFFAFVEGRKGTFPPARSHVVVLWQNHLIWSQEWRDLLRFSRGHVPAHNCGRLADRCRELVRQLCWLGGSRTLWRAWGRQLSFQSADLVAKFRVLRIQFSVLLLQCFDLFRISSRFPLVIDNRIAQRLKHPLQLSLHGYAWEGTVPCIPRAERYCCRMGPQSRRQCPAVLPRPGRFRISTSRVRSSGRPALGGRCRVCSTATGCCYLPSLALLLLLYL